MATKTILTDAEIIAAGHQTSSIEPGESGYILPVALARAIERSVLQSPEIQALKRDKERLDWLADPENYLCQVQLPRVCVERNLHSLRDAIDDAMETVI